MKPNTAEQPPVVYLANKPPQDEEAELCVLGSMFMSVEAIEVAANMMSDQDFAIRRHGLTFETMVSMAFAGEKIDTVTLRIAIERQGIYQAYNGENSEGLRFIASLLNAVPSPANVSHYAARVVDKSLRRKAIEQGRLLITAATEEQGDAKDILAQHEHAIASMAATGKGTDPVSMSDAITETLLDMEERAKTGSLVTGVPFGFSALDTMTTGLHPGDLAIVAGRPGLGKTSLAMDIAIYAANAKHGVYIASLEMPRRQLMLRAISQVAHLDLKKLRSPAMLSAEEWQLACDTGARLRSLPLYVDDETSQTEMQIRSKCRRLRLRGKKVDLVIVDYLQLLRPTAKNRNRVEEVTEIAQSLKRLARQMEVPVLALCQLSRATEARQDKIPELSDLRESGAIEQEADLVTFIYNPSFYGRKRIRLTDLAPDLVEDAEIIVAKQRQGMQGAAAVKFVPRFSHFLDVDIYRRDV